MLTHFPACIGELQANSQKQEEEQTSIIICKKCTKSRNEEVMSQNVLTGLVLQINVKAGNSKRADWQEQV